MKGLVWTLSLVSLIGVLFLTSPENGYASDVSMQEVWELDIVVVDYENLREKAGLGEGCGFLWMGCLWDATFGKVGDAIDSIIPAAMHALLTFNWYIYKVISYFLIEAVSWAFSLQIVEIMYSGLKSTLQDFQEHIWNPFKFFMWAVALAWIVFYWISGKNTKMWSTLVSSILIIAISATVFLSLPDFLRSVSRASACVSETILIGFAADEEREEHKQNSQDKERDQSQNQPTSPACQSFTADDSDQATQGDGTTDSGSASEGASQELNDPNATGVNNAPEGTGATQELKQTLIKLFIINPWKLINFGNYTFADSKTMGQNANWQVLMNYTPDPAKKGEDHPVYIGIVNETKNLDQDAEKQRILDKYSIFTIGKIMDRLTYASSSLSTSLIALILFFIVSLLCIIWQFIALGRATLAAVYLLIALWPEYGAKEAAMWGWSMIQALFMKVFYTICLAVFITLSSRLSEASNSYSVKEIPYFGDVLGFLIHWMLMIGMFVGLWFAMRELRQKLEHIPLGDGMMLRGTTREAEDIGKKAAQVGVAGAAVAATVATGGSAAPALGAAFSGKGGALKAATAALAKKGVSGDSAGKKKSALGKGMKHAAIAGSGAGFAYYPYKAGKWATKTGLAAAKNLAAPKLKKGFKQAGDTKMGHAVKGVASGVSKATEWTKNRVEDVKNLQTVEGQKQVWNKGVAWNDLRKDNKSDSDVDSSQVVHRKMKKVVEEVVDIDLDIKRTVSTGGRITDITANHALQRIQKATGTSMEKYAQMIDSGKVDAGLRELQKRNLSGNKEAIDSMYASIVGSASPTKKLEASVKDLEAFKQKMERTRADQSDIEILSKSMKKLKSTVNKYED